MLHAYSTTCVHDFDKTIQFVTDRDDTKNDVVAVLTAKCWTIRVSGWVNVLQQLEHMQTHTAIV